MTALNGSVEELREDVPLRRTTSKTLSLLDILRCQPCIEKTWASDFFTGMGLIYTSFCTLTIAVTLVLCMQMYYGAYQIQPHGGIASDSSTCSLIGTSVLKKGGNAVDAAIATTVCLSVVNPHITGLAAGGILMIYNHRLRTIPEIIDFGPSIKLETSHLPRLIIGLAYAHLHYGKLPWQMIITPSVLIARNGFMVPQTLATAVEVSKEYYLFDHPMAGKNLTLPSLADTLEMISDYTDEQLGNLISSDSSPLKAVALNTSFYNYNIYVPNVPSSGPTLFTILDNMYNYNFKENDTSKPEYVYRLAEIIQENYIRTNLSSRMYEENASTVSAVDLNDLYVTVVTGLNQRLGMRKMSPNGYLIDTQPTAEIDTFSIPIIVTDKNFICGQRYIFGTGDVSLAVQIISSLIIGEEDLAKSIENARFRVLNQNVIGFEENHVPRISEEVKLYLKSLGTLTILPEPYDSINIIKKLGDVIETYSDSRGGGKSYSF